MGLFAICTIIWLLKGIVESVQIAHNKANSKPVEVIQREHAERKAKDAARILGYREK